MKAKFSKRNTRDLCQFPSHFSSVEKIRVKRAQTLGFRVGPWRLRVVVLRTSVHRTLSKKKIASTPARALRPHRTTSNLGDVRGPNRGPITRARRRPVNARSVTVRWQFSSLFISIPVEDSVYSEGQRRVGDSPWQAASRIQGFKLADRPTAVAAALRLPASPSQATPGRQRGSAAWQGSAKHCAHPPVAGPAPAPALQVMSASELDRDRPGAGSGSWANCLLVVPGTVTQTCRSARD